MKSFIRGFFLLALLVFPCFISAQDIPGYNMSNYAGVSGVDLQPASIADMRYKVDITLIGAGIDINNNYISAKGQYIRDGSMFQNYAGNFQTQFLTENTGPDFKQVGLNAFVQLPSFAISITKNISVAFTWRLRSLLNIDDLNLPLAHLLYTGLSVNDPENRNYFNNKFNNNSFDVSQMTWWEYGIDYAQVIKNEGHQFLKAGVRVKLEAGLEAAYIYASRLSYSWKNNDTLNLYNSSFQQGHTENLVNDAGGNFSAAKSLTDVQSASVAFDIGVVYEWRPDYFAWKNQINNKYSKERRDLNKYKIRFGASVLDLGFINFKKGDNAYNFVADKANWNVNALNLGPNKFHGIDTIIAHNYGSSDNKTVFAMYLPTTFSLQLDYHVFGEVYVNLTTYTVPHWLNVASQVHTLSYYLITPRWDNKWFGLFIPVGINGYGQPTMGLTARLGPIIVGTSNGLNLLFANDIYGLNAYAALKIPILYNNPKKRKKDVCPEF